MDDKTFELLTQMYSEITSRFDKVDSKFDKVDSRFDRVESRLDKLEARQTRLEIILEHDIKNSLQALHEREAINTEKLERHEKQLTELNSKMDYLVLSVNSQDKRLVVLESVRGKKVK